MLVKYDRKTSFWGFAKTKRCLVYTDKFYYYIFYLQPRWIVFMVDSVAYFLDVRDVKIKKYNV